MKKLIGIAAAAWLAAGCSGTTVPPGGSTSTTGTPTSTGGSTVGGTSTTTSGGATTTGGATSSTGGNTTGVPATAGSTSGSTTTGGTTSNSASTSTGGATSTSTSTSTGGTTSTSTSTTTGGTTSGTSTTGGTTGASACEGLVPGTPGAPVQVSSEQYDTETHCGRGFSDGAGNVLTLRTSGSGTTFRLFTSSGAQEGSDLAFWQGADIDEQLEGFLGTNSTTTWTYLIRINPGGSTDQLGSFQGVHGFSAPDPTGGMVVWMADTSSPPAQSGLHAYDANGNLRWFAHLDIGSGLPEALGVDRAGNSLFLWVDRGAGVVRGVWADASGHLGAPFDLHADFGLDVSLELRPQLGSGLFLRTVQRTYLSSGDVQVSTQWLDALPALQPAVHDAPSWLTTRPNTDLHPVHGGAGYAILPEGNPGAGCSQTIEILAPDGTSCGARTFPVAPGTCTTRSISVGYDGTVIQQLPKSLESCTPGGDCSCTYRWWPAYFH